MHRTGLQHQRRLGVWLGAAVGLALAAAGVGAAEPPPIHVPVGGANSPEPSPPPELVGETAELACGTFSVKVPVGEYQAPAAGAPAYSVPGPIVAFKGADGAWRGHGYLELSPRLVGFSGILEAKRAVLDYRFEGDKRYQVTLQAGDGVLLIDETCDLGPRNRFVFDCYDGWQPSAGFAVDLEAKDHAFLTLPCHYDKAEVTVSPVAQSRAAEGDEAPKRSDLPGGVAVTSPEPDANDVAGFFCRQVDAWEGGDTMGFALWQHRQLPGDPASRHFLGPETKSDSTPNPRTAPMLGPSLYEGHVTVELSLGRGKRRLGFAVTTKGETQADIPEAFKKAVRENP